MTFDPRPFEQAPPRAVSRDAAVYGNDKTGEVIAITHDGREYTAIRMQYPDPNYPQTHGAATMDILYRNTSHRAMKQWMDAMRDGQKTGKFYKLKRYQAEGTPVQMDMPEERLPNPQSYTETSWGTTEGYGPDRDTGHPQ